jgi:hypothetical protein
MTYNNMVEMFRRFTDNHYFLKTFVHGEQPEMTNEKLEEYPLLFLLYTGSQYAEGTETLNFEVYILDLPLNKETRLENQTEVVSDCKQVAEDILADIELGGNIFVFPDFVNVVNASILPAIDTTTNLLSGVILSLGIDIPWTKDSCNAPITGVTPSTFAQDIVNTDGVILRQLTYFQPVVTLNDIEVEDVIDIFGTFPQPRRIVVTGSTIDSVVVDPLSGEMIIDTDCADATYSNGGAFVQQINSGSTYTAPQITVTDVDGSTRNVLPNIGVTCAWSPIAVKSTDDVVTLTTISSYPVGGVVNTADQRIRQQDNSVFVVAPFRTDVKIMNADISAVAQPGGLTEITVVLPPAPTPSGIAYKVVAPMSMLPLTTGVNDSRALFISGWYDRTNPVYPVSYAEIDSAATQADVRVTPATGTLSTASVIHTILKHNNAFGNKLRFTDSLGRESDATVGSDLYAHVNWLGHSFSGAIDKYVIDHLTGDGYYIKYVVDSGDYNLTNTAVGKTWADWMTAIASFNLGGFTDWKPLDCCTLRPHANKANLFESWAANFFISSRAPGEIAGQTDNRVTFITGENANSLNFNALYDSGSSSTIFPNAKATSGGFAQIIANVFPMRRHY